MIYAFVYRMPPPATDDGLSVFYTTHCNVLQKWHRQELGAVINATMRRLRDTKWGTLDYANEKYDVAPPASSDGIVVECRNPMSDVPLYSAHVVDGIVVAVGTDRKEAVSVVVNDFGSFYLSPAVAGTATVPV